MRLLIILALLTFGSASFAVDIASCSNPNGKSYYPELGLVDKKDAGWTDDEVSGGITKLTKDSEGEYDILFVDATKEVHSSRADGGNVIMLSAGTNIVSFLVLYVGKTAEIYTFLKNKSGANEYIHIKSSASDAVLINKASLMRGDCDYIRFDML